MGAEIDFADVVVCDDSVIARVGSVVGCDMVERASSGESDS